MLRVLGVRSVRLMTNNPAKIEQLQAHGVRETKRIPLEVPATATNRDYLLTKKERMHHLLNVAKVSAPRARR